MVKMELIKIRFGEGFDPSPSALEKNLVDMFRATRPSFNCSDCPWSPPMDIIETPDEIRIVAEIAGVAKDDLAVEITGRSVKISGRRPAITPRTGTTYRLAEIHYGGFERTLYLPREIDSEHISASYSNGLLQIRLAKQSQEQPYQIPIMED
jgi:HSP20 family protein